MCATNGPLLRLDGQHHWYAELQIVRSVPLLGMHRMHYECGATLQTMRCIRHINLQCPPSMAIACIIHDICLHSILLSRPHWIYSHALESHRKEYDNH